MLCTLNLYSDVCQLYLNKTGKRSTFKIGFKRKIRKQSSFPKYYEILRMGVTLNDQFRKKSFF